MATCTDSNSVITTVSLLSTALSIPAIIWRCAYAYLITFVDSKEWKESSFILGLLVFLFISLAIQVSWLILSFLLFIFRQKAFRTLMWMWIVVTWSVIIIDSAFIGYYFFNTTYKSFLNSRFSSNQILEFASYILYGSLNYMPLLLIHIVLAYMTIKVGCYVKDLSLHSSQGMNRSRVQEQVISPIEIQPYPSAGTASSPPYENHAFKNSENDARLRYSAHH